MLFNQNNLLAVSLMLGIPLVPTCDCEHWPEGEGGGGHGGGSGEHDSEGDECVAEESDSECRWCLQTSCCRELAECEDDGSCGCVVDCLASPGVGLDECARVQCGVEDVTAALEPLTRWCDVGEQCGDAGYCELPELN